MAFGITAGAASGRRARVWSGKPAAAAPRRPLSPVPALPALTAPADPFGDSALIAPDGRCAELDCLRSHLDAELLAAAERRAARIGVGADRVLIAGGLIDEEIYLRALGQRLGIAFEPLDGIERRRCPLDDDRLIDGAASGLLPLLDGDGLALVVAPRGTAARRLATMIEANPALAQRFRLTTAERFTSFMLRFGGDALAARATGRLRQQWPGLSAAPPRRQTFILPLALMALPALAAILLTPAAAAQSITAPLALLFLAWLALRLAGAMAAPPAPASTETMTGDALPVYSVIAALYREASSVDGLLAAIERLDYPPEKLDVILAVEAEDRDTRAAIAARSSRIPISLITVPAAGPRTKPKALNVALPFARGTFTAIYDAEDRPEPEQLREALQAFCHGGDRLACVQAPLCVDNTADSWLTRLFTAEYAGQFDVFLPGLAAMSLPLPLGGSSNHFRTATLRAVGGWDPYNVTEDADLGMRLARFGYRAGTIRATTYEEAPARAGAWLRQRTRWFKGWMQTWLVHMSAPRRLLRDLGWPGFVVFQLIVGGSALAALVHPLFLAWLIDAAASGGPLWSGEGAAAAFYGVTAAIGYLVSGFLGWLGLKRRGLLPTAWALMLMPVHWLLLSLAAWRALYQLIAAPYAWEKTEHGLAKSSRRGADMKRALLELERHLTELKESGKLPALGEEWPPPRAGISPLHRAAN